MDVKDLRTENLSERNNDDSKYTQSGITLQSSRNKSYQDIGSIPLAKAEPTAVRPCAVIGPGVPPPVSNDAFLKKVAPEPWPSADNLYRRPPEYPQKMPCNQNPSRNISPRQTFQENMQRIMVPPTYNIARNSDEVNLNHIHDRNNTISKNIKINIAPESKYCDVPYTVNTLTNEPKNVRDMEMYVPSVNSPLTRTAPHGWPPSSVNVQSKRTYGAHELYQHPQFSSCAGQRPTLISMARSHRMIQEDPAYVYPDHYYQDPSTRFTPYPPVKERYQQPRYDYIANYPSHQFHPASLQPHKYDISRPSQPHPYAVYPQLKYLDNRVPEPSLEGYQRSSNQPPQYNTQFRNQAMHPAYSQVSSNNPQNKLHPYSTDANIKIPQNKLPINNDNHSKMYIDYENVRSKPYPITDNYFVNEMSRVHTAKPQMLIPNYSPIGMHTIPAQPYYRKDNPHIKPFEYMPHFRNFEHPLNSNAILRHAPQFSPNTLAISPTDSNTSIDTAQTHGTSQEDCGYMSQSSTASVRSVDYHMPNEYYKRYDVRYGPLVGSSPSVTRSETNSNCVNSKDTKQKQINVRQFLQMWNEGEEENSENTISKEILIQTNSNDTNHIKHFMGNQDQLYVLGLVNVPSEELSKYEHIQKISKLPENIKGYNSLELLSQFEEAIESSNTSSLKTNRKEYQIMSKDNQSKQLLDSMPRPVSPLDVEAKISQSVIHKEVGCNFEIKPCSPKMLNVEVAAPVQNILGERVIEKITNPLSKASKSPLPIKPDDNSNCHSIKIQENTYGINDSSSCKMIKSPYATSNIDTVKSNYSLQDLEINSGVCLASLPRLDNEIELVFPEVNQQFINANKKDNNKMITNKYSPNILEETCSSGNILDTDKKEKPYMTDESGKTFTKLSKYRKIKTTTSDKSEKTQVRTDSVIIKNPENIKNIENKSSEVNHNIPINLSSQTSVCHTPNNVDISNNLNDNNCNDVDIALDFSLNKTSDCLPIINIENNDTTKPLSPNVTNSSGENTLHSDPSESFSQTTLNESTEFNSDDLISEYVTSGQHRITCIENNHNTTTINKNIFDREKPDLLNNFSNIVSDPNVSENIQFPSKDIIAICKINQTDTNNETSSPREICEDNDCSVSDETSKILETQKNITKENLDNITNLAEKIENSNDFKPTAELTSNYDENRDIMELFDPGNSIYNFNDNNNVGRHNKHVIKSFSQNKNDFENDEISAKLEKIFEENNKQLTIETQKKALSKNCEESLYVSNTIHTKIKHHKSKELYSPIIQKLLTYTEGLCRNQYNNNIKLASTLENVNQSTEFACPLDNTPINMFIEKTITDRKSTDQMTNNLELNILKPHSVISNGNKILPHEADIEENLEKSLDVKTIKSDVNICELNSYDNTKPIKKETNSDIIGISRFKKGKNINILHKHSKTNSDKIDSLVTHNSQMITVPELVTMDNSSTTFLEKSSNIGFNILNNDIQEKDIEIDSNLCSENSDGICEKPLFNVTNSTDDISDICTRLKADNQSAIKEAIMNCDETATNALSSKQTDDFNIQEIESEVTGKSILDCDKACSSNFSSISSTNQAVLNEGLMNTVDKTNKATLNEDCTTDITDSFTPNTFKQKNITDKFITIQPERFITSYSSNEIKNMKYDPDITPKLLTESNTNCDYKFETDCNDSNSNKHKTENLNGNNSFENKDNRKMEATQCNNSDDDECIREFQKNMYHSIERRRDSSSVLITDYNNINCESIRSNKNPSKKLLNDGLDITPVSKTSKNPMTNSDSFRVENMNIDDTIFQNAQEDLEESAIMGYRSDDNFDDKTAKINCENILLVKSVCNKRESLDRSIIEESANSKLKGDIGIGYLPDKDCSEHRVEKNITDKHLKIENVPANERKAKSESCNNYYDGEIKKDKSKHVTLSDIVTKEYERQCEEKYNEKIDVVKNDNSESLEYSAIQGSDCLFAVSASYFARETKHNDGSSIGEIDYTSEISGCDNIVCDLNGKDENLIINSVDLPHNITQHYSESNTEKHSDRNVKNKSLKCLAFDQCDEKDHNVLNTSCTTSATNCSRRQTEEKQKSDSLIKNMDQNSDNISSKVLDKLDVKHQKDINNAFVISVCNNSVDKCNVNLTKNDVIVIKSSDNVVNNSDINENVSKQLLNVSKITYCDNTNFKNEFNNSNIISRLESNLNELKQHVKNNQSRENNDFINNETVDRINSYKNELQQTSLHNLYSNDIKNAINTEPVDKLIKHVHQDNENKNDTRIENSINSEVETKTMLSKISTTVENIHNNNLFDNNKTSVDIDLGQDPNTDFQNNNFVSENVQKDDNENLFSTKDDIDNNCKQLLENNGLQSNNKDSAVRNINSVSSAVRNKAVLKRSHSDSALHIYKNSNGTDSPTIENTPLLWPAKRQKISNIENPEHNLIHENICSLLHSNRRNSVSSFYNEDNVSFCILIDNDCIITEENEEEKVCFAQIAEDYVMQMNDANQEENDNADEKICSPQQELNLSESIILDYGHDKSIEEAWLDDVACVETVVSDDIDENLMVSSHSSPTNNHIPLSELDEPIFFTDEVKLIDEENIINASHVGETCITTTAINFDGLMSDEEQDMHTEAYNVLSDSQCCDEILLESNSRQSSPVACQEQKLRSPDFIKIPEDKENMFVDNLPTNHYNPLHNVINHEDNLNKDMNQTESLYNVTNEEKLFTLEFSIDTEINYKKSDEILNNTTSSSPEVSSTTSEEKSSSILLKITNFNGSRVSEINEILPKRPRCKFTEKKDFNSNSNGNFPKRPLLTKAAQKYIPPLKESIRDLKVKLTLPQQRLLKLKQLQLSRSEPKVNKQITDNLKISKKPKLNFEDVLKNIDEVQIKMHKEKSKKPKSVVPKVVIKKNQNGSHYTSLSNIDTFNPDMTGRKWQPWVFIEKNNFIDIMALKNKTKAIYNYRKKTYVLAEKFKKYKSVSSRSTNFIMSQPTSGDSSKGHLKYTIRLKHAY